MTIGDEKKLAKEYMKAIKKTGLIIEDPIISDLITSVGNEIVSTLPPQPFTYSFYAFNVDTFNAFATPGANIFINRGLITSLDNVDELAGIMAHETAHAAFRHVAQLIDKSTIVNLATLAGVIAGVLIGSKGDGELGKGLTMGSLAAGQSAMLTYTREHEREADQKGFDYITKTNFSPTGLLTGLKKIRAADFYGTDNIPDYLKTHPGTTKRIKSLEIMLARYSKNSKPIKPAKPGNKNYNYDMVKYRIIGLYQKSSESNKIFTRLLQKNPENAAYHYGYALALTKQLKFDKANIHLKKALEITLFDPLILLEIGNLYLHDDQPVKAVNIFKDIKNYPIVNTSVAYSLSKAQIELGNYTDAKENLQKLIDKPSIPFPKAYYYIAKIYSKENNPGLTHYYLGHYYFKIKNKKSSRMHLTKALETLINKQKIEKANSILKELKEKK
ncbi:MAG: M48 family metalloprotease [Desulfobacteraceae bacterium]|nr:M48 family metalloprotease [Desulfobacteraceae bacterium]